MEAASNPIWYENCHLRCGSEVSVRGASETKPSKALHIVQQGRSWRLLVWYSGSRMAWSSSLHTRDKQTNFLPTLFVVIIVYRLSCRALLIPGFLAMTVGIHIVRGRIPGNTTLVAGALSLADILRMVGIVAHSACSDVGRDSHADVATECVCVARGAARYATIAPGALKTGLFPMSAETGRGCSQGTGEVDHCTSPRDVQTILGAKFQDYPR